MTDAGGAPARTRSNNALTMSAAFGTALCARGWTCATAESCTGGGIAGLLTAIPGSSDYVVGGIVAYSNPVKARLLGVSEETLRSPGAVSAECATQMLRGARERLGADVALCSTGIAGPGGATARKPVGLVYIGVETPERSEVRELHLAGDRLDVIDGAILAALELALELIGADAPETE